MSGVGAKSGLWIGSAALILLLAACGGLDGGSHGGGGSGSGSNHGGGIGGSGDGGGDGDGGGGDSATEGHLQITLSGRDAPGFESLRLSVTQLDVHDATASPEDGWVPLEIAEHDLDVVQLIDGRMTVLADTPLPAGGYDAIRITFADPSASVLGLEQPLMLVGGGDAVLQPDNAIWIEPDMAEVVELDFDAIGSVQVVGHDRFKLQPAVSIVNPTVVGSISGTVIPPGIGAEVRAYLEPNGALVAAASVRSDGSFTLPRLPVYGGSGVAKEYRILATAPGFVSSAPIAPVDLIPSFAAGGYAFTLESAMGMAASEYYRWWEEAGNSGHAGGAGGGNGNGGGKKNK